MTIRVSRWGTGSGFAEDTVRLAAALQPALASRGVPETVYVDYPDPVVMPTLPRVRLPANDSGPG